MLSMAERCQMEARQTLRSFPNARLEHELLDLNARLNKELRNKTFWANGFRNRVLSDGVRQGGTIRGIWHLTAGHSFGTVTDQTFAKLEKD